jgi:hypothetical protein
MGLIMSTKPFRINLIIILDFKTSILMKNYSENIAKNTEITLIIEHRNPTRVTHILKLYHLHGKNIKA